MRTCVGRAIATGNYMESASEVVHRYNHKEEASEIGIKKL